MSEPELIGFANPAEFDDNDNDDVSSGKKKGAKKSGGFQGMALSFPVLKGVLKRGYKIPTPIQRKVCIFIVFPFHALQKILNKNMKTYYF